MAKFVCQHTNARGNVLVSCGYVIVRSRGLRMLQNGDKPFRIVKVLTGINDIHPIFRSRHVLQNDLQCISLPFLRSKKESVTRAVSNDFSQHIFGMGKPLKLIECRTSDRLYMCYPAITAMA